MAENDAFPPKPTMPAPADKVSEASAGDHHQQLIYRHAVPIRLTHWINVLCLVILFMSGLQIFNAHPALYWGNRSDSGKALFSINSKITAGGELTGVTTVFGHQFNTTGVLGSLG